MKTPAYLRNGDAVGIIAPARKIKYEEIEEGIKILESWGLHVITGPNTFKEFHQFSGTDLERAEDFQFMLDNDEVKAVFCARGGYGSVRIIDQLDFSRFIENAKWIIGYSDITVFHSHIHTHFETETLHAEMPFKYKWENRNSETIAEIRDVLFGTKPVYKVSAHEKNNNGYAKGQLIGGNLSMLYSLMASPSDIDTRGKILFIEDIDEYLYHIDRMMMNLDRVGKLSNLAGLIVGGMTGMNDNTVPFGETANEIISRIVLNYDFPKIFGFPAGHLGVNKVLILGREYEMMVKGNEVNLQC